MPLIPIFINAFWGLKEVETTKHINHMTSEGRLYHWTSGNASQPYLHGESWERTATSALSEPFRRGESMSLSGLLNMSLHIIDVHDMQDKSADKYVRTDVSRLDDLCQGSGWLHHVKSM